MQSLLVGCTIDTITPTVPITPGNYSGRFIIIYCFGTGNKDKVESRTNFTFTDTSYT